MTIGARPASAALGGTTPPDVARPDTGWGPAAGDVAGQPVRPGLDPRYLGDGLLTAPVDVVAWAGASPTWYGLATDVVPPGQVWTLDRASLWLPYTSAPTSGPDGIGLAPIAVLWLIAPGESPWAGHPITEADYRDAAVPARVVDCSPITPLRVPAGWRAGVAMLAVSTARATLGWSRWQLLTEDR